MSVVDGRSMRRLEAQPAAAGTPRYILQRAALLLPQDRAIVELALKAKVSRCQIGSALSLAPGTVSRRLQRIGARLHDPIVGALLDERCPLAADVRRLGIEHFLQGLSTRQLAERHRMSREQVRHMLTFIRGWYRGTQFSEQRRGG